MLSAERRREFEEQGFVRLPSVVAADDVRAMRERLWKALADKHRIDRDDPGTWSPERPARLQSVSRSGAFEALDCPALREALDELLGAERWVAPTHWGPPLVAFPTRGASWTLPHENWHLDAPASGSDSLPPGVRAFGFLDRVEPGGGATVVVSGSHRRLQKLAVEVADGGTLRSEKARTTLARREPWIKELFTKGDATERATRFMAEGTVSAGIPLRVVELTGEPGDITLMDLRCLHAPAPNVNAAPRLVIGLAFHRTEWLQANPRDA